MNLKHILSSQVPLKVLAVVVPLMNVLIFVVDLQLEAFDTRLFFAPSEVPWILAKMSGQGRKIYAMVECFDLLFICLYTVLFVALWKYFLPRRSPWPAFLPGAADVVETVTAFSLAMIFPQSLSSLEVLLAIATPLKWIFFVVLLVKLGRRAAVILKAR